MKKILAALALSSATFCASAAPETYVIDGNHSLPTFEYNHMGLSTASGRFGGTKGTITLDLEKKAGAADIAIDVNSVVTGVAKLDEHLKSKDFFEADKYPTITFKSSKFTFEGDKLAKVAGDLTIHGVTKPVALKVTSFVCKEHPVKKTPACGADATTVIKRSEFGVGAYVPAVGDEVTLRIQVEAQKQ
jgi:polyisoprenoid-binding protein YceI